MAISALFALSYATIFMNYHSGEDFAGRPMLVDVIARNWFYVGAIISGAVLAALVIGDIFRHWTHRKGHGGTGGMAISK